MKRRKQHETNSKVHVALLKRNGSQSCVEATQLCTISMKNGHLVMQKYDRIVRISDACRAEKHKQ